MFFVVINGFSVGIYEVKPLNGIQQGLDLTGGVYTVYQAQDTSVDDFDRKMDGAMLSSSGPPRCKGIYGGDRNQAGTDRIRVEYRSTPPVKSRIRTRWPHILDARKLNLLIRMEIPILMEAISRVRRRAGPPDPEIYRQL